MYNTCSVFDYNNRFNYYTSFVHIIMLIIIIIILLLLQHEIVSQKVFKDIFKRLKEIFEAYGITEEDIDIIAKLIHYRKEDVPKEKAFLYQVCV